jgi:hypothetical protein
MEGGSAIHDSMLHHIFGLNRPDFGLTGWRRGHHLP